LVPPAGPSGILFHPAARGRDMPVIKINGQQYALQPGQNRLGGGTTADVSVGSLQGVQAIVDLGADGRAIIRKAGAEGIRVNGTELAQPMPLIHGDKVEIAGNELFFADDVKQGGSTQFVSAADVAAITKRTGPARGTLSSGGRLVSLVDGKEYAIPDGGITIGRDASADIVVAQTAVSRRHAQVIPGANGYVVNDLSTNGVFVNGEKATSGQALSRADVIRVGTEEFRFYADLAPIAKPGAAPAAAAASAAPPRPATPPAPPAAPPQAATPAAPARPAAPPPAATPKPAPGAAKAPTPPDRPATPAPAPARPASEPVTTKKGVPMWAALLVIVAVLAVAAYFITAAAK
jgi:pSer/pThr/pTyr-binding forkhead associated (FHA) protein